MGRKTAFLIQNICPITPDYIENEYLDKNNIPVRVPLPLEKELQTKAKRIITLVRNGYKGLVFKDILSIENILLNR